MIRRIALALGLLYAALAISAFATVTVTTVNNAAYTILSTDTTVVTGATAFTASRTWTLPSAGATCIGQSCSPPAQALQLIDAGRAISTAFPLVVAPASGETINGSSASLTVTATGGRVILIPSSGSNWIMVQDGPTQVTVQGTAPTVFHSGGIAPFAVATGTDATAVNTETYIVEVFVPVQTTLTGVKWLGLATSTGNVQFCLADSTGAVITAACSASTATAGSATYQTAAFAVAYAAKPGKYFILMQNSGSNHFRAHAVGNFGASKKTGETYGTFTAVTPPTTFTADLGPIADLY